MSSFTVPSQRPEGMEGDPFADGPPELRPPPSDNVTRPAANPARRPRPQVSRVVVSSQAIIALLLALLTGAWLSRRFTRPLLELVKGARALRAGRYHYRVPVMGDDEFAQLASALNDMAGQVSTHVGKLEDDAKRRRQFLADVAHELRTPVTTMRTMAGALEEGLADDPERHTRAVCSLVRTSDRMLHLVTDLLELAKLDLHELPLHRQPVDLHELASICVQAHTAAAAQAKIRLHILPPGEPLIVNVDADRIAQVLYNLLNNAISYAGEGAEVGVTLQRGDPVQLVVTDTGHGIPARHLPYIFDAFFRGDAARTPGDAHCGLGLRITRGLVMAHGGTLTMQSSEEQGTRAIVTLPIVPLDVQE